jgi:Arc/MetJ-type ribon-helix-helix transcriptional regulator
MKRKISVAIDESLLEWVHVQIQKKRFASVSHAVNYALNEAMGHDKK